MIEITAKHVARARAIAWTMVNKGEEFEEVLGDALLGLAQAADRFDPDKNNQFLPWAMTRIYGAIRDGRRKRQWISRRKYGDMVQAWLATDRLEQELGRRPTQQEAREELGRELRRFEQARLSAVHHHSTESLDKVRGFTRRSETEALTLMDTLAARGPGPAALAELSSLLELLDQRELLVVKLVNVWGVTLREVGELLGLTESRICQINTKALNKMREAASDELAA